MKRELKFRAWDKNTQQMIYDGICIKANGDTFQMYEYWSENGVNGTSHIIEQFTGLKDKNGVDIYEGDIIEILTISNRKRVVEYIRGAFRLTSGDISWYLYDFNTNDEIEVIGNTHEDPELIKSEP